jgi:hypothetical protein
LIPVSPSLSLFKIKGVLLCAKPYEFTDYVKSTDSECPSNYILCGRDSRYFLCFPNTRECPLNHIFFSENPLNLDYSYSTILISDQFRLYFSNSQTEFPLITTDFQLGLNKEVCIDTTQILLPSYHYQFWTYDSYFPEDGCPTKISSELSYLDSRYVLVATQPFKELLYSNDLKGYSDNHKLGIFDFFESKEDIFDIDIMFRPRIYYNSDCQIDNKTPANSLFTLSENSNSEKILGAIIASFVMGLITSLLGCTGIILKNFCSRKRTRRILMMVVLSAFIVLFTLTLIPVIILYTRVKEVDHSFFQTKIDEGIVCGDRYVHAIINEIVHNYKKTSSISIALIFFIILSLISWIVFIVFKLLSDENEYEVRTQSARENSMKTIYVMGTITENERYTNDREEMEKVEEDKAEEDDEETWHDNRIASYIPQKFFIDEEAMNSYDSEAPFRPEVKSRILGISKTIRKVEEKNTEDDYYKRKQKRRNKNKKLQKRLEKQKMFEMINTINSKNTDKGRKNESSEDSSSENLASQIAPEKYNTITIMSPNLSMDESKIINNKMTKKQPENKFNFSKNSPKSKQKEDLPKLEKVDSEEKKMDSSNENNDQNKYYEEEVKMPNKITKSKLLESVGLLKNNPKRTKRTPVKRKITKNDKANSNNPSQPSSMHQSIVSSKVKKPRNAQNDVNEEPMNQSIVSRRSRQGKSFFL